MKKNKRNLRKKESIVNLIVSQLRVQKWVSLKKLHVDHTKIATSKFAFQKTFTIFYPCLVILEENQRLVNGL